MELNFPKLERKILKFWKKNRVFEKSIEQRKRALDFVFYEGPPTANAKPGLHHATARVYKDIICRYKTMQGFRVLRKAGWDTHGLPVELEIEKKLELKSKKDIEKYGIARFNKRCKESVWQYKKDWEELTERIAFWLDVKNPYITYENDYIETLWWIIKQIHQKGLLYKDYKVVPYCSRCGTSLSSHEVAQGYKKIKEPAVYVKFQTPNSKTYLLVWTTTPWTLPGNVAVAVNPEFIYVEVKIGEELFILAKERLSVLGKEYTIIKEFKGKDLIGLQYQPLFGFYSLEKNKNRVYEIIGADFVSLKEGTGLVHIAPAFGEEDMIAVKRQIPNSKFQIPKPVDEQGKMITPGYRWDKMFVKEADPLIVEDLKTKNLLFKEELYEHDYPFCWRCNGPLLYYAKQSWFINMQKVKKELIKNNQKINWVPAHLKEGRFGEWLRELKDWAFSRERYWGTPLPVWQCKKCGQQEVIGSKKDLLKQKFSTNKYYILRHGQTIYQTDKKEWTYPWPEKKPVLLTKAGQDQIKKAAKELKNKKIDLIYSSDISRTRQTAEIAAKELGVKIIFDKRLRDVNLGIYHGGEKKKFYQDFPETLERFYGKKPPQGENWGEVKKRMIDCLNDIDKKYQNKTILIISHGDPLWFLEGAVEGLDEKKLLERKAKKTHIKLGEWRKIEYKKLPLNEKGKMDFHRPYVDEVEFYCQKCSFLMKRVPEVIDCWFDSGAMPFAQNRWLWEIPKSKSQIPNKFQIPKSKFPADYICEGIDQTRGWFYTLLAISTLLGLGPSYKNVISLGHILDEKGEKMSKSKGNVVDPWDIIEKYGTDAIRWYFYTVNQPGDSKSFSERDIEECLKKFILTLWNCQVFLETYQAREIGGGWSKNLLDRWIVSRLNKLIQQVTKNLETYDVTGASRLIEKFVIEDLSQWYIRRSRKRFQKPENKKELKEASETLNFVLTTLTRLTAPFIPFLSEEIHKKFLKRSETWMRSHLFSVSSVHLCGWPKVNKKLINDKLEKKMEKAKKIVALALAERMKARIKIRQPLKELKVKSEELKVEKELVGLIKEEVNVKEIVFDSKIKKEIEIDTQITPELREEGMVREVVRNIQEMRKKAGLKSGDKISVNYCGEEELNKILEKNKEKILKEVNLRDFVLKKEKEVFLAQKETLIDQRKVWLAIKKI